MIADRHRLLQLACLCFISAGLGCGDDDDAHADADSAAETAADGAEVTPEITTDADAVPETRADIAPDAVDNEADIAEITDSEPDDSDVSDADAEDAGDVEVDATPSIGRLRLIDVTPPIDLSSEGDLAVLEDFSSPDGDLYFYGTLGGVLELVTTVGSPLEGFATGVSDGGRVSALHGSPVVAGLWTLEGGWLDIPSPHETGCDNNRGGAWDVSAEGDVAVGFFWNGCATEAFRWSDESGTGVVTPLEVLGKSLFERPPVNRPTVLSDDGAIAAGFAENETVDRSPAIWRADGSGFLLDPDERDAPGEVLAISADGSVVAGTWGNMGFFWSEETGVVYTGVPPEGLPNDATFVNAIAADGALLFGTSGDPFFGISMAFVWTDADGARQLQGLVVESGVEIPEGLILTNVVAASRDGSILLGTALDALGNAKSFVLELPVSVYGLD